MANNVIESITSPLKAASDIASAGREAFTVPDAALMEPASMADGRVSRTSATGPAAGRSPRSALTVGITHHGPGTGSRPLGWPSVSSPASPSSATCVRGGAGRRDLPDTLIRGVGPRQLGTLVVQPAE